SVSGGSCAWTWTTLLRYQPAINKPKARAPFANFDIRMLLYKVNLAGQRGANCLAESLRIRRPFGQNDIVVDEERLFDVLSSRLLQLLDGLRQKVDSGLAARE